MSNFPEDELERLRRKLRESENGATTKPCLHCGRLTPSRQLLRTAPPGEAAEPVELRPRTHTGSTQAPRRAGYRCERCGSADRLHVDAIIPAADGGDHRDGNTQVLCVSCHNLKTLAELRRRCQTQGRDDG